MPVILLENKYWPFCSAFIIERVCLKKPLWKHLRSTGVDITKMLTIISNQGSGLIRLSPVGQFHSVE